MFLYTHPMALVPSGGRDPLGDLARASTSPLYSHSEFLVLFAVGFKLTPHVGAVDSTGRSLPEHATPPCLDGSFA